MLASIAQGGDYKTLSGQTKYVQRVNDAYSDGLISL